MPTKKPKLADFLVEIRSLVETRAYDESLLACQNACTYLPENAAIHLRLATIHKLMGAYSDATKALEISKAKGLSDEKYFAQKLDILWVTNDFAKYIATAQHMRQSGLEISATISRNMIKCYYMGNDWAEAENEADTLLEQNIDPVFSNYKIIAALMADGLSDPIGVLENRIFSSLGNPFMASGVMTAHMHMDEDPDALLDIAQRMAAKWPKHPAILPLIDELKQFSTGTATIKNRHLKTGADAIFDAENLFGRYQDAAAAFKRTLSPDSFRRNLVMDIACKDILISPRGDSDTVALVFLGAGGGAMGPIQLLDSYLAAAGITAIYIRDFHRLIYTLGVKSLGDMESTAAKLSEIIADIGGHKNLIAIGFSGGGMGALNIGPAMNADRIICFSSPANATLPFLDANGDTRAPVFKYRLDKLAEQKDLDVKVRIERFQFTAPIELYYSNNVAIDRAHAEYLGDLSNAKLLPFYTKHGHNSFMAAVASGWIEPILADDCSGFDGQNRQI